MSAFDPKRTFELSRLLLCNLNPGTPFRRQQIPAVIVDAIGVVLSLEEGDATTRFH
jgi:hypothetical protein